MRTANKKKILKSVQTHAHTKTHLKSSENVLTRWSLFLQIPKDTGIYFDLFYTFR